MRPINVAQQQAETAQQRAQAERRQRKQGTIRDKLRQSDFCQWKNILNGSSDENDNRPEGVEASSARLYSFSLFLIIIIINKAIKYSVFK